MRGRIGSLVLAALLTGPLGGCSGTPAGGGGASTSQAFQPAVTYTLPEGWDNPVDSADYFALAPAGSKIAGIHLFANPRAASQDSACPTTPEPGVGTLSSELATWIRSRPGLEVGNPKMVTVGGLRGVELDVAIVAGWKPSCPFAEGIPTVPLFVGPSGSLRWVIAGSERLRLDLLDVPGGGTVVVDVDAFDGSVFDDLLAAAAPIVRTFSFAGS